MNILEHILSFQEWLEENKKYICPKTTIFGKRKFEEWKIKSAQSAVIASTYIVDEKAEISPEKALQFVTDVKNYLENNNPSLVSFKQYEHTIEFHAKIMDISDDQVNDFLSYCYSHYVSEKVKRIRLEILRKTEESIELVKKDNK